MYEGCAVQACDQSQRVKRGHAAACDEEAVGPSFHAQLRTSRQGLSAARGNRTARDDSGPLPKLASGLSPERVPARPFLETTVPCLRVRREPQPHFS